MFDIGWTELLVIGIVALIVVGPKDLPRMFRALGQFTAKARGMAREFQRAMESAANEAGVKDVAKDLRAATDPKKLGLDALRDAAKSLDVKPASAMPVTPTKPAASPVVPRPVPPSDMDAIPDPPEPAAAAPSPVTPAAPAPATVRGPATQALAEQQAARRAEIIESVSAARGQPRPAAASPATPPSDADDGAA
jgi:sec-independent protein translocase protein TatB